MLCTLTGTDRSKRLDALRILTGANYLQQRVLFFAVYEEASNDCKHVAAPR